MQVWASLSGLVLCLVYSARLKPDLSLIGNNVNALESAQCMCAYDKSVTSVLTCCTLPLAAQPVCSRKFTGSERWAHRLY